MAKPPDKTPETREELLADAHEALVRITASLPNKVERSAVSDTAKTPFKAQCCKAGLLWRTEELTRSALSCFEREDYVAGVILTRAVTECAAALLWLNNLIERQITKGIEPTFYEMIDRLFFGYKNVPDMPEAVNVMTMIQKAGRIYPAMEKNYNVMSEFAHPNWSGSAFAFSKPVWEDYTVHFGRGIRESPSHVPIGLKSLGASLLTVEYVSDKIDADMPELIRLCEEALK